MFFPEQTHSVEEDVGELFIPVHRSGDVSQELMVVCYTQQGMAGPLSPHLTSLSSAYPAFPRLSAQTEHKLKTLFKDSMHKFQPHILT